MLTTTAVPQAPRRQGRRAGAILVTLLLLIAGVQVARGVSTVGAEVARTEALPSSFTCVLGSGALATAVVGVILAPPAGVWSVTIDGIGIGAGIIGVVDACGAWITTPVGELVRINGWCDPGVAICVPPPHSQTGGGGGGGGSW
jgi:hypothetical protein